jgi:hypothetical protein
MFALWIDFFRVPKDSKCSIHEIIEYFIYLKFIFFLVGRSVLILLRGGGGKSN